MSRPTTPFALGHIILTAVFIAVPVLMFAPNLILRWDQSNGVHVGDSVIFQGENYQSILPTNGTHKPYRPIVTKIEGGTVYVEDHFGHRFKAPIEIVMER